jgi:mono/diheme cytochrome c family protein
MRNEIDAGGLFMFVTKLKKPATVILALLTLGGGVGLWASWSGQPGEPVNLIKRGEYLVTITRCGDCHTPRTAAGELDTTKHLQGAPTWFTPKIRPRGEWATRAQDITMSGRAGLWSEAKMIKFLSTGAKADNPMPAYTMSVDDARAVTAYLRSLPGRKKDAKKCDDD